MYFNIYEHDKLDGQLSIKNFIIYPRARTEDLDNPFMLNYNDLTFCTVGEMCVCVGGGGGGGELTCYLAVGKKRAGMNERSQV